MKTPRIPFTIALFFISLISFAQKEKIKLNVERGQTYVFESELTITEFDKLGNPISKQKGNSEIHVEIEKFDGKNLVFLSKIVSGTTIREDQNSKVKSIINWKFPSVVNDLNESRNPITTTNRILPMTGFRYKLNLDKNTIEFINKSEVLDSARKIMLNKGYTEEFIAKGIDFFREGNAIWDGNHEATQFIAYFNNSIQTENVLKSPFLNRNFQRDENDEFIHGIKITQPGPIFSKVELSKKHGFPVYYFEAKHDSIREKYRTNEKYSRLFERQIVFKKEFQTGKDLFTFEFSIDNPKDSFITIKYMDNPYSLENTEKTLKLNNNNQVFFQTKLQGPTIISIWNNAAEYKNRVLFLVAEPTDSLIVKFSERKNNSPWQITGTNEIANQLINEVHQKKKSLFNIRPFQTITKDAFDEIQNLVGVFDTYAKTNNISTNESLIQFIRNELIAIEYFYYFAFLNRYYSTILSSEQKNEDELIIEREMLKIAEDKIKDFGIHDYYNDYGIFSRRLSIYYFHYYLNNLSLVKIPEIYSSRRNIQEEFEIGKMILGGSIFYRVLAYRIVNSITRSETVPSIPLAFNESLTDALNLINRLINQSYSEYFKQHLQTFRDTRLNWENESYIPETTFYAPDGSTVKLEDVINGKPTVFYINKNWRTYRYDFDREATNNPNIRYVMLMEGNNLAKWQDYVERAEPVAEQLFLLSNKDSLEDIFLRSTGLYIVYDKNGKLVEYDVEKHRTTKLAKQSLEQKKELDKSQLQTIVIILLMLLILFAIGLIIWKWRVRQRFRKEEQQRRLRELELTAIRSQMNPHFLFNSLNSVQNLVQQNKGSEAHLYLSDFAGLIRKVLQNSEKEEVSLAEELEMVQQYLNLEKLRFNFDYSITVDDKIEKYSTVVPSNILQPVVENAIVHGLNHKSDNRMVKIEVQLDNRGLKIIVEDNGIGRVAAAELSKTKNGKGLKLVEERLNVLQQKQGERYDIEIIDFQEDKSGTRVEILIPDDN